MAKLLLYYAHPGHRFSNANREMTKVATKVSGITYVDLYSEYPRFDIDVDTEQQRLVDHDVVLFQFPLFWYSSPSLIKEWQDLVLEHGFAYGQGGDNLHGKSMMLAVTAAGPEDAYTAQGYQNFHLRDFLRPFEQTANLTGMRFIPPYVLFGALAAAENGQVQPHADGFGQMLQAIRDDRFDYDLAGKSDVLTHTDLPIRKGAAT